MDTSIYTCFHQPIEHIDGIGQVSAKKLKNQGCEQLGDLLFHLPKTWIDDRLITPMNQLVPQQTTRIQGCIMQRRSHGFGRKATVLIKLVDVTGVAINLSFFHAKYMMNDARLSEGKSITVRGMVQCWGKKWSMTHPDWSTPERFVAAWQPVYASIAGFSSKKVGVWVQHACNLLPKHCLSPLDKLLDAQPSLMQALFSIHNNQQHAPDSPLILQAIARLQIEELVVYLSLMQQQREHVEISSFPMPQSSEEQTFIRDLPFVLSVAQKHVWAEIGQDLAAGKRMHRLLQGDVGAGKTWVAALAMVRCFAHHFQSTIMAPTEVLAQQHFTTLSQLLNPLGIEVALLTGSTKKRERKQILKQLADGCIHVLIGTHALISSDVLFQQLGLVIVDEQHRFGVQQRWALSEKGEAVHLLAMTATPIPRSLALALYGDMDLSVMHGLPAGRKPIETRVLAAHKMSALADALSRMLAEQGRIYWIVPRIDDDEDHTSVDERLQSLQQRFPQEHILGLHGKMKAKAKQAALQAFSDGTCRMLVSTTVVEVGVNVPEARVMVIEQADAYGLAQLHQLRGRVGRSSLQSFCMLIPSQDAGKNALNRLQLMMNCHNGLELAEFDLQQRGSGDAVGTRQSGEAGFRLIDPALDAELIQQWHHHAVVQQLSPVPEVMLQFWRPFAEEID